MLAQGHIYPTNLLCKSGFTNSDRPQLEIRTQISESPGYMARRSTTLCRCRYVACRGPALSESSGRSGLRINKPHVEPHLSWRIHPLSSMFSYQIWITPSLPISVGWSLVPFIWYPDVRKYPHCQKRQLQLQASPSKAAPASVMRMPPLGW